ncbi:MAG: hypothetical protein KK478_19670, partial [Ensifer alkalisoli]|nr:hypothetical protein [Sinorhizobium alkalisoli]
MPAFLMASGRGEIQRRRTIASSSTARTSYPFFERDPRKGRGTAQFPGEDRAPGGEFRDISVASDGCFRGCRG